MDAIVIRYGPHGIRQSIIKHDGSNITHTLTHDSQAHLHDSAIVDTNLNCITNQPHVPHTNNKTHTNTTICLATECERNKKTKQKCKYARFAIHIQLLSATKAFFVCISFVFSLSLLLPSSPFLGMVFDNSGKFLYSLVTINLHGKW